jgi:hypothetical protein
LAQNFVQSFATKQIIDTAQTTIWELYRFFGQAIIVAHQIKVQITQRYLFF